MVKTKVMLVLESPEDMDFLQKILNSLGFEAILMTKGADLSEQLIDHFPDIVFASTLGRNEQILSTLGKIKRARGKPRLVYIRQDIDTSPLSLEQRKIIDGVLYTPIDPLRLIDVVASMSHMDISELKKRYQALRLGKEGDTIRVQAEPASEEELDSQLIRDPRRKSHYDEICKNLQSQPHGEMDPVQLRERQRRQSQELQEDPLFRKKKKEFVKKLFTFETKKKSG